MAEFVLPPEMEAFAEAAGDAAMGPFQALTSLLILVQPSQKVWEQQWIL